MSRPKSSRIRTNICGGGSYFGHSTYILRDEEKAHEAPDPNSTISSTSSRTSPVSEANEAGSEPNSTNSEVTPAASNTGNAAGPAMTQNAVLIGMAVVGGAVMLK